MNRRQSGLKRALIAGTATTVFLATTAWAQATTPINIPAQPLESALTELAQQTGVNIVFESRLVAGLQAAKLHATLTAEEAARRLVGTTGLKVASDGAGGLMLQDASRPSLLRVSMVTETATASVPVSAKASTPNASDRLEEIIVTARKRSEDALTIPTAITAISGQDMALRGLDSVLDIATYTPGVTDLQ